MTPLITEMVNYCKDISAEKYAWFDISEQWAVANETIDYDRCVRALQNPLPFDKCSIVGREKEGSNFIVLVSNTVLPSNGEKGLAIHSQILWKDGIGVCPIFFVSPEQTLRENSSEGMAVYFLDQKQADNPQNIEAANDTLVCISFWLEKLNENTMLTYNAVANSRNPKRIRQGKKPLFDWHTVVLEPRSVKSEYLGGTHSSPRLHDVRGHWVVRGNKKFWRKPHKRGDASKGVIFHDYKLKGEKHDHV
jgi:hypothetical protein